MTSVWRQHVLVRRFKYLPNYFIYDEVNRNRVISKLVTPRLPEYCRKSRPYLRLGGIIGESFEVFPEDSNLNLRKLTRLLRWKFPNGDDGKNQKDFITKRDEEIKRLQDLRQRTIQHTYDQESVWKAMKERDELFRRDKKDNDKRDEDSSDNDGSK